jgi:hypothetical protein
MPDQRAELDGINQQIAAIQAKNIELGKTRAEQEMQLTLTGQLTMKFKEAFEGAAASFKNFAETMASAWTSASDGISDGLKDVIFRAKTLNEAFQEVARTVVHDLVKAFIKMAINWVAQQAFMAATEKGFSAQRQALAVQEGVTIAAAMAPAAAASSVATMGGGAASGLLMAGLAIAGIVALIAGLKGFEVGGLVPGVPSTRDNRLAKVATGEFVVNSRAVSHYGAGIFEALNNIRLPRRSLDDFRFPMPSPMGAVAFAGGGLVGPLDVPDAPADREINVNVAVLNTREDMRNFMRGDGRKQVVDIVSGASWKLGI